MALMTVPDAEQLDTALARGLVRQQIAACERYMALLAQAGELAQEQRIANSIDLMTLVDLQSNVRRHRDALENVVRKAMGIADSRAPRRASAEILALVAS